MERETIDGKQYLKGYHAQECRFEKLERPIRCLYENAWLGAGYYFWTDLEFARYWGEDFKCMKTGAYDIHTALLDIEKCINAVFNEDQYFFYRDCIEKAIAHFKIHNRSVTLNLVNEFLSQNVWRKMDIQGIIYDDIPMNPNHKPRKYSLIEFNGGGKTRAMYYKKRIQVVMFNPENIHAFALVEECVK